MYKKEEIIRDIWKSIFGKENTYNEANFFELGGDSITAIKMSELLKQNGYKINLLEVFDCPTLEGVISMTRSLEATENRNNLKSDQLRQYPATLQQRWFFENILIDRNQWCEYVVIVKKNNMDLNVNKIAKLLFSNEILRNYKMVWVDDDRLFFQMDDVMPSSVNLYGEIFSEKNIEKISKENIDISMGKTCCLAYNDKGELLLLIHHLFSDAITLNNIISIIDTEANDIDKSHYLYGQYAWNQNNIINDSNKVNKSFMKKSNNQYESVETTFTSEGLIYHEIISIAQEWKTSIESILLAVLLEINSKIIDISKIEVEKMGRELSGTWNEICGWMSFAAKIDFSDCKFNELKGKCVFIDKKIKTKTVEIPGDFPEKSSLSFNYLGNFNNTVEYNNYKIITFGQVTGKTAGRFSPIYFSVYFSEGRLVNVINYDSLMFNKEIIDSFQKEYFERLNFVINEYKIKKQEELDTILSIIGD